MQFRMARAEQLRRAEWAVCLGATVAAIGLHVVYLTHAGGLWRDETNSIQIATSATAGEVWRLWTGHLVHYNAGHLLWDLAVFVPAGMWLEAILPGLACRFYLLAPPAISAALFVGEPGLVRYAGLSGLATGVLVLLALVQWRRDARAPRWFWPAVLALVALKIGLEAFSAEPLLARFEPGVRVVTLAHVGGVACAIVAFVVRRLRSTPSHS